MTKSLALIVTKENIIKALEKFLHEKPVLNESTGYDLVYKNLRFPPKEVIREAARIQNIDKWWEYNLSGGDSTNRPLTNHGFIIEEKENSTEEATKESLIRLLKKTGRSNTSIFFNSAIQLLNRLEVKIDDQRLTYGTSSNNRFTITIGKRYCLALIPNQDLPWRFIQETKIHSADSLYVNKFDGNPEAYYFSCLDFNEMEDRADGIYKASEKELKRTELSGYRKSNNPIFEKALFDTIFRNELFEAAFGKEVNLTGNVWKLGCNWGTGSPSFYEMIKVRSIVIGVSNKLYSPGDLIVITEGYTVYALGKILEIPRSVTDEPELEDDFDKYKIEYNANVNFAQVEWYELEEEEIFTYQLQQGICRVNVPYVRNNAITIWNDRFINYWLFQGNPLEFDFEKAVTNDLLRDWTVSAHKDKIKIGDKIILWLTGKRAGCYALARITENPREIATSSDDHLWKVEPKTSLKAGIELTHNLLRKPLLWQNIKDDDNLKDLKAGNQGTNFSATKKQYRAILNLIEKNAQNMDNKIDLFLNTILYGPPGTGKTYQLNKYKEQYFIDRGITKSSEEVLREKIAIYPFWKIFAAVLNASGTCSVAEIMAHPLVKAKISETAKTPQNTIWRILQSYADSESTQMNEKYRGPIQLFHKNSGSEWSIIDDKRAELMNIIDQDLLDIAANPVLEAVQSSTSKIRFNFITFHQKYSYEDFIEGIKPVLKDGDEIENSGDLKFELKRGIFYNSCLEALKLVGYESFKECYTDAIENRIAKFEAANNNPSKQFALFIDEINRANISAVFGELITLLEDDKRIGADNEMWIELPYSNEKFCVPLNLYVIGTMNTADRSIALLDIALRRRFEFKALYPLYTETEWWGSLLEAINQAIYTWRKNPDFFIGHAFFINHPVSDKTKILNTKIIPLLYEYCQNNADTVKRILSGAGIKIKEAGIKENFQIVAE